MHISNNIIEFVGTAGSGKTTLCKKVYKDLDKSEYKRVPFSEKKKIIVKYSLLNSYKYIFKNILLIKKLKLRKFRKRILVKLIILSTVYDYLSKNDDNVFLEDEGILQRIRFITRHSELSFKEVSNILVQYNYKLPKLCIIVDIEPNCLKGNLKERDNLDLDITAVTNRTKKFNEELSQIIDLSKKYDFKVLTIKYENNVNDVQATILKTIKTYF